MDKDNFDFWYAVNNTRVVLKPSQTLETFGTTVLKYHLITELMDAINHIRVREGTIKASRPQIITPSQSAEILEGFGDEARDYLKWLKSHEQHLQILQYGFTITKQELREEIVTDHIEAVVKQVEKRVKDRNESHSAVVIGVDKPWEVCLLKLLRDVVSDSAPTNIKDLVQRRDADSRLSARRVREGIERGFEAAARNPALIGALGDKLQHYGLFQEYEDRFFSLLKSHRQ